MARRLVDDSTATPIGHAPARPPSSTAAPLDVKRVQTSYMQVADQLRDLILSGDLSIGQRLPSEAELAPLFGVSRSTVREALRILVTDGLITTRRGVTGGAFVADVDPARVEGVLNGALRLLALTNQASSDDYLVAWEALEVPAAGLAAARKGGDLLDELDTTSRPFPRGTPRSVRLQQSTSFHHALSSACGNPLLVAMARPVATVARARFSRTDPSETFWKRNTAEHRRIFDAVAAGDVEAARHETALHVRSLADYYSGRTK